MGGALEKAAKEVVLRTCCGRLSDVHQQRNQTHVLDDTASPASSPHEYPTKNNTSSSSSSKKKKISSETESPHQPNSSVSRSPSTNKNLCTICLDPLIYSPTTSPGRAIFTAQCSHAFHFACISSNVRHGSITCPICRAPWTQLPRRLKPRQNNNNSDPILQILDDSIATSRLHRRSFLLSGRYDGDDDSVDPHPSAQPLTRLSFSLCRRRHHGLASLNGGATSTAAACLNVKLSQQPPIDLVLIASYNGPNIRLVKQMMATVVFSLRPVDRLAVVNHSSAGDRVFPLRRMSSYGKRSALRVVDRLFYYSGQTESSAVEVVKKGAEILADRAHKNPQSCLLHLTMDDDDRSSPYCDLFDVGVPFKIHRFDVGFGLAAQEFEEFLAEALGGGVRDVRLRIGDGSRFFGIEELRGGEERSFPVAFSGIYGGTELPRVRVEYSYVDNGLVRNGEVSVGFEDKGEDGDAVIRGGERVAAVDGGLRMSSGECTNWDYHDALMARRWAKHLHGGGYR